MKKQDKILKILKRKIDRKRTLYYESRKELTGCFSDISIRCTPDGNINISGPYYKHEPFSSIEEAISAWAVYQVFDILDRKPTDDEVLSALVILKLKGKL